MSKHRTSWEADARFRVPSTRPGITFQVSLHLEGTRPERMPEPRAIALAQAAAERAITETARRYSVLADEAATIAATAAVLSLKRSWRGSHIEKAKVHLHVDRASQIELRHLEVLRRIVEVAGPGAVEETARVMSTRHVVLDDHASTVAHLLINPPSETKFDKLPHTAAELRTRIDDYRPDESWIRVAGALKLFVDKKASPEVKQMLQELSRWIAAYNPELSKEFSDALSLSHRDWRS